MIIKKSTPFLFLTLTLSMFGCKQMQVLDTAPLINKKIDSILQEYHAKETFNGSILVIKDENVLYKNSFGYADGFKKIALTENHRFGIGSIYKEFPAVAIMQLYEADNIQLEDTIDQYLPNLPEWSSQITIKNLLQYTSGLPRINFGKYFSQNKTIRESDVLSDIQNIEHLDFPPGTDYLYSNNNPFLLIKIIESVSGKTFTTYTQEHLFEPYNLKNTIIKDQYPYTDTTLMAIPINEAFEEDQYNINVSAILFSSTTEDLYHWMKALHSYSIISKQSLLTLSETATVGSSNLQAPLGNCKVSNNTISEHIHHGSSGNYEGIIQRFNNEDLSIVVLTNQKHQNVFEITEEIRGIIAASILEK